MGILVDKEILEYINLGIFKNFESSNVLSVGYDLRPLSYYNTNSEHFESMRLEPGDSIFVGCKESVDLPKNMTAIIKLRNSRIRQGLQLEAPLYQPGHTTQIYYRLTNVSKSVISLSLEDGTAYIVFNLLDKEPTDTYNGTFQNEEGVFFAMSSYSEQFRKQMSEVEDFAFLIMPFGEEWSDDLHDLIKKVGEKTNIKIIRADDIYGVRPVMHDVARSIEHARFVISIMTGGNRNVNYELGLAHAWGKPSIMIASSMSDIPFDYQHLRVIIYDMKKPDWGNKLSRNLEKTMKSILDDKVIGYNYFETNHQ